MDLLNTPLQPYSVFLRSSEYTTTSVNNKSNLFFELNQSIRCFNNMNILMKLSSFKYTNSFYTINDNNKYFYYQFLGSNIITVTLNKGNYDVDTLLTYLQSLLSGIFTFSYDTSTLKISISSVSGSTFSLISNLNNCLEVLGFDTNINTSYSSTLTAPYLMNLMGVEILHICVNNINLNSVGVKDKRKYNILDSISVNVSKGETETYINYSSLWYKISETVITFLNIVIYDQDFNVVDFNNIDWYINIIFAFSYIPELLLPKSLHQMNKENEERETTMYDELIREERRNLEKYYKNINM